MSLSQIQSRAPIIRLQLARPAMGFLLGAVALILLAIYAPTFFKLNNLINILVQTSALAVMAIGMAAVMIGGGIDLSLPFNAAFSAVLGAMYMRATGDPIGGPLVMVVCALAIGAFNGLAVAYLGMIPFVVTLAMMTVTNGAAVWLTNSISISGIPDAFVNPFFTRYFGIPLSIYIAVAVAIFAYVLMSMTVYGRWLYAVGINAKAARVARVPNARVIALSYVFAGFIAGIAAIMLTGRLASASSNLASPTLVLDVVSACVVGGVSIYGGVGRAYGAVLGALFITLLGNALNAAEVTVYANQMIRGAIIIGFVAIDRFTGEEGRR
jgi:ribose/xylose/arabinose/galactoside ABC-type transport system permease subunit